MTVTMMRIASRTKTATMIKIMARPSPFFVVAESGVKLTKPWTSYCFSRLFATEKFIADSREGRVFTCDRSKTVLTYKRYNKGKIKKLL